MTHIVSSHKLFRPGYDYYLAGSGFVGIPRGIQPYINWRHIDGPLLYRSDGQLHWLTLWERFRCWLGLDDALTLNRKLARLPLAPANGGGE